jgi:hypothetical protein
MKLSQKAKDYIKNNPQIRLDILNAGICKTDDTIRRNARQNKGNNILTTVACFDILKKVLPPSQILTK